MPRISEDDVIDFLVTEAIVERADELEAEQDERQRQKAWKRQGLSKEQAATAIPREG